MDAWSYLRKLERKRDLRDWRNVLSLFEAERKLNWNLQFKGQSLQIKGDFLLANNSMQDLHIFLKAGNIKKKKIWNVSMSRFYDLGYFSVWKRCQNLLLSILRSFLNFCHNFKEAPGEFGKPTSLQASNIYI